MLFIKSMLTNWVHFICLDDPWKTVRPETFTSTRLDASAQLAVSFRVQVHSNYAITCCLRQHCGRAGRLFTFVSAVNRVRANAHLRWWLMCFLCVHVRVWFSLCYTFTRRTCYCLRYELRCGRRGRSCARAAKRCSKSDHPLRETHTRAMRCDGATRFLMLRWAEAEASTAAAAATCVLIIM